MASELKCNRNNTSAGTSGFFVNNTTSGGQPTTTLGARSPYANFGKRRKPSSNNCSTTLNNSVLNPGRKIPIIRETRSSRMRRSALVVDVMRKKREQIREKASRINKGYRDNTNVKDTNRNSKKQSTYNQVDNNLTERIPKHLQKSSFKGPGNSRGPSAHHNRILEMSNMSATLNNSFELVNSGAGSPRINVHPDEFITDQSFNRYQRHRSPEKSLDDQAWRTLLSR